MYNIKTDFSQDILTRNYNIHKITYILCTILCMGKPVVNMSDLSSHLGSVSQAQPSSCKTSVEANQPSTSNNLSTKIYALIHLKQPI